jgi:dTDP-4-dehydrorhamnose reductase
MKVLVLGVTGMLGSTVFKLLSESHNVWGTLRHPSGKQYFANGLHDKLICDVNVLDQDELVSLLSEVRPDIVINCVGLIKQLPNAKDPLVALPVNAMFPQRLAKLCDLLGSRLVHISTDCVFSGEKGMYVESDVSDANDLYGKSKYIGELHEFENAITLRTSIIGHELSSNSSLVDWFLSQQGTVKGFSKAFFSGLPTIELAHVIKEYVIPNKKLHGLYHVSVERIDKCSLLKLVADIYGKKVAIVEDSAFEIDRSLNSDKFRNETGYKPPSWPELIHNMFQFHSKN